MVYARFLDYTGFDARHLKKPQEELQTNPRWTTAVDKALALCRAGGIVTFLGDRGNGKTQASLQVARRLAWMWSEDPASAEWETVIRYLRCREVGMAVRSAYGRDCGTEMDAVSRFVAPRLLVLDECQERMDTDHEARTLTLVLDKRYGQMRPTILVANCTEAAFRELMGAAVIDRVKEGGGILVFKWESFRGKK